ncbi:MAG TPA: DUF3891 family protein [Thermoanaerobaculia bacterium]|nr:DUF3891 family protein [Thermoanaerobaculia bacterium]
MIVAVEDGAYRLVTQPDHAHLAGEILSLWRADGLAANPRRGEVIFAGREHDNGWREADAAPRCAADGRPVDFIAMPREQRFEIWERGTARFLERRPYAALLIVRHARELHRARRFEPVEPVEPVEPGEPGEPGWRELLGRLAKRERRLRREQRISPRALAADYRLLSMADSISLAACAGRAGELDLPGMRGRLAAGTVRLAPLPLAGATTFRVPCRRIPRRPYRGDADLGGELAAARWEDLVVRLAGEEEAATTERRGEV